MSVTKKSDIDKLPIEEQLEFYKLEFQGQHCEESLCDHEVYTRWVQYKGILYCEECYEWRINAEKEDREQEIERLRARLKELESK